jgi:Ni/Co efflux regulator RcnB
MNTNFFLPALIAAVFAASAPALAQDRGQYNGERRDGNWQQQQGQDGVRQRGGDGRWQEGNRGDDGRRGDYRGDGRRDDGWRDDGRRGGHRRDYQARNDDRYRGAGPYHDLRRGARLPSQYNHRQYVVDNWRAHRLSAPPRGYHWVQAGDDYVLAAIATGLIAQILLNN